MVTSCFPEALSIRSGEAFCVAGLWENAGVRVRTVSVVNFLAPNAYI